MLKKTVLLFTIFIIFSNIAVAGTLIQFSCSECGFKSDSITEGCGFAGIENTVIFCNNCKKFDSIPAKIIFQTEENKSANIVEPMGEEEFLEAKRLVYPCPRCGSKAFAYDGPVCPICKKGVLRKEETGLWD